ncbi:unnamed protein product [Dovyalis caffra]|uniref:Uncharacterized protein n=1 Tax=Dovyalis caffra TaxID=77055 RepID=A0AAV1RTH2_9ROSI|nr:unnamed protein product [Dovyalis caffra]
MNASEADKADAACNCMTLFGMNFEQPQTPKAKTTREQNGTQAKLEIKGGSGPYFELHSLYVPMDVKESLLLLIARHMRERSSLDAFQLFSHRLEKDPSEETIRSLQETS